MIEVERLSKRFVVRSGRLRRERQVVDAVREITFRVERGELLGYLGPNGAGKSTTIKMLTGILVPSAGHVRVAGLEPSRKRIELARRIGAMFGHRIQLCGTSRSSTRSSSCGTSTASRRSGSAETCSGSATSSSSTRSCRRPCASCPSASASAAS